MGFGLGVGEEELVRERDYTRLISETASAYEEYAPKSAALHRMVVDSLVDGGSHAFRLIEPFPPRIVEARGAWISDVDVHMIHAHGAVSTAHTEGDMVFLGEACRRVAQRIKRYF